MNNLTLAVASYCLLFSAFVQSEQLSFKRQNTDTGWTFTYRWTDLANTPQELNFTLDRKDLDKLPEEQPVYRPQLAQRYAKVELLKAAQRIDPRTAHVDIKNVGQELQIQVRSRDDSDAEQIKDQLEAVRDSAFDDYLAKNYYVRYTTPMRKNAVKPDHLRYINDFTFALIPLSQALYEKLAVQSDAREYFNLLLSWVQSIPYNALDDRISSNGSGFVPPNTLLVNNKGDCDSKSVLTASITRAFLPTTPMVLILLRDHALLGVALPKKAGDKTIKYDGITYVLMEPTGPAQMPFGHVAKQTSDKLASGVYTVEKIQ